MQSESLTGAGTINYNLAFWAIAVTLNMLLTILILTRLLSARKHATATLGSEYGKTYTGIAAVLIESAAPYAMVGFVWIILYGIQNWALQLILPLLVQVEVSVLRGIRSGMR